MAGSEIEKLRSFYPNYQAQSSRFSTGGERGGKNFRHQPLPPLSSFTGPSLSAQRYPALCNAEGEVRNGGPAPGLPSLFTSMWNSEQNKHTHETITQTYHHHECKNPGGSPNVMFFSHRIWKGKSRDSLEEQRRGSGLGASRSQKAVKIN